MQFKKVLSLLENVTKEEFWNKLENHDWFYENSDDQSYWRKGAAKEDELIRLMKGNDLFKKMYKNFHDYIWHETNKKPSLSDYKD